MAESGKRKIRLGMVGGGTGAFIGYVHRIASRLDGDYELVAGAFSSRPEVSKESGRNFGVDPKRTYGSWAEMVEKETRREDGIEAVSIVTPNNVHFAPAKAFLEAGINVICDKPMTATLADARALAAMKPAKGAKFLLTHNYTGYPLMRQAREMVKAGLAGETARRPGRIRAGLADHRGPQQAGRLARRSQAVRCRRRHRRYRHACLQYRPVRHGPAHELGQRRSHVLCPGPQARRQRPRAAALPRRRARHALGQPGRAGQRECP